MCQFYLAVSYYSWPGAASLQTMAPETQGSMESGLSSKLWITQVTFIDTFNPRGGTEKSLVDIKGKVPSQQVPGTVVNRYELVEQEIKQKWVQLLNCRGY